MTYSRFVAWMKVLLPLAALCLLSTLFLFARSEKQGGALPFAQVELEEKIREQVITAPFFSGLTQTGDAVSITAATARPDPDNSRVSNAETVHAQIDFSLGDHADFRAGQARVDLQSQTAELSDQVEIASTNGIKMATERLIFDMGKGQVLADTQITGEGPFGQFEAGSMELRQAKGEETAQFHFKNGVKMLYLPDEQQR